MKSSDSHNYRPDIDGLRAIAIILVVAYHAFPTVFKGGFIGVDVFFVISGFLISRNIFKGLRDGSFSILEFYGRRARRIIPALVLVLTSITLLSAAVSSGIAFNRLGIHLVGGATFTSNLLLLRESGYFDKASELKPFLHLWSLGIEEQFYLFWPAVTLLVSRARLKLSLLVLLLFVASFWINIRWAASDPAKDFYSLASRFWELLAGCALALPSLAPPAVGVAADGQRRFAALKTVAAAVMLSCAALLLDGKSKFPGWWALLPTGATCLFISAGPNAWWSRHVLANRLLVVVGLLSYPLYLWHWPLLAILRAVTGVEPSAGARLAVVALSVSLAFVTWKFVELPLQKIFSFRSGRFLRSSLFAVSASLGILGGLAIVGSLIHKDILVSLDHKTNPVAYQLQRYAAYDNSATRVGRCFVDTSMAFTGFDPSCYRSDGQSASVMLLGDSHAAHLYPGLVELFDASGLDLLQLNASSCPPLIGLDEHYAESCHRANEFIFRSVHELRPEVLILEAEWTHYYRTDPERFRSMFEETVRQFVQDGVKSIVVIGPVPDWDQSLHQVLEKQFLRVGREVPARTKAGLDSVLFTANEALRRYSQELGAQFISLTDQLCDADGCRTLVGPDLSTDLIVYDTDHLTVPGARFVSRFIIGPKLASLNH